jgi:hypothetical protein
MQRALLLVCRDALLMGRDPSRTRQGQSIYPGEPLVRGEFDASLHLLPRAGECTTHPENRGQEHGVGWRGVLGDRGDPEQFHDEECGWVVLHYWGADGNWLQLAVHGMLNPGRFSPTVFTKSE